MALRMWTDPRTGEEQQLDLLMTLPEEVTSTAQAAKLAFEGYILKDRLYRSEVLEALARALEDSADELVELADLESALGEVRLRGELARTTFQLRMFASALLDGSLFSVQRDEPVEGAPPAGRPELVRVYQPLGPVAVFGASNFPFAFSVLGGDTASALAAGCSVVVKEHSAHPRLGARTVEVARAALQSAGMDENLLQSVRGTEAGALLVAAPEIQAVGFTGSVSGGRALWDIAVNRPQPIPFYGELGSVNPVIVTKAAAAARGEDIGRGFVDSMLLGAGQFCTKPSILIYPAESNVVEVASSILGDAEPMALLTPRIAAEYSKRVQEMSAAPAELVAGGGEADRPGAWVRPTLFTASVDEMLNTESPLREECFGPSAVVVPYHSEQEALWLAQMGEGVLVGCLHAELDDPQAISLAQALGRRAGRVVWNGWPTGVAVSPAQMHGGPYPASTVSQHTSVGLHAAYRFARPVVWQSFPEAIRP